MTTGWKRPMMSRSPAGEPTSSALVVLDDVWRHWGRGSHQQHVLSGVDLEVEPGSIVAIVGGNGAGKTTLLRIATAILSPHRGTVTIDNVPSTGNWREYHRRIGFLSAGDRGLYARFSVRGHLRYAAKVALLPRAECGAAVETMLDRFGLQELAGRRADRLSQGQRQRLRLALTFVHQPRVVMLDEPRNSLDGTGLAMLTAAVGEVRERAGAVIWCCPADESQPVSFDHQYVLEAGKLRHA